MKEIKVRVKMGFNHPYLRSVMPVGFETVLVLQEYKEDTIIVNATTKFDPVTSKHIVINPPVIAKKGTLNGKYTFKTNDGETHSDGTLEHYIGPRPISEVFTRIDDFTEVVGKLPSNDL